jgi:hypothetical protein
MAFAFQSKRALRSLAAFAEASAAHRSLGEVGANEEGSGYRSDSYFEEE